MPFSYYRRASFRVLSWIAATTAGLFVLAVLDAIYFAATRNLWEAAGLVLATALAAMTLLSTLRRQRPSAWEASFLAVVILLLMASTSAAQSRSVKWVGKAGAISTSGPRYGVGPWWVDINHTGYYPVGGFVAYRFHMRVDWKRDPRHYGRIAKSPDVQVFTTDERFIDYQGVVQTVNKQYNCRVNGKWRKNGCFYAYRKAKVVLEAPIKGHIITTYPWVAVWLSGNGEVLKFDWSKQLV